jgi:hypothetical protein
VLLPRTIVGFSVTELSDAGETVSVAAWLVTPKVAVIVTDVEAETAEVVIVNAAIVLPAGTVTEVGTEAAGELLLDSATRRPPVGAAPDRVMVP